MAKPFSDLRRGLEENPEAAKYRERARRDTARALSLADLRKARAFTQQTLAQSLDTNQSGVSRIERQTDLYLSTLARYVEALGGELEIRARFLDQEVVIGPFGDLDDEPIRDRDEEIEIGLGLEAPEDVGEELDKTPPTSSPRSRR